MAREELSINVTAKDDASKVLDQVGKKVDKLEGEDVKIKVGADTDAAERDIQGLLEKVDKLAGTGAAELLLSTNASQITNEIGDLVIKLDTLDANDPQVDVTVANIAQLSGDLDQISAKAKEISDTPIVLDTSGAVSGIDDIAKSADSSKSVMANMVGNATQDLGALGGIAGSAGVAIGQMGEYMVDAANSGDKLGDVVGNFAKVAGPIALIAIGIQTVTAVMDRFGDSSDRTSDNVDDITSSMRDGSSAADAYAARIQELGQVTLDNVRAQSGLQNVVGEVNDTFKGFVGQWRLLAEVVGATKDETENITPSLVEAGVALKDWSQYVADGTDGATALREMLAGTSLSADEQADVMTALGQAQADVGTATLSAAESEKFFGTAVEETTAAVGDDLAMLDERNKRLREMKDAYQVAAAGLAQAVDDADAFAAAFDRVNEASELDFSTMALDTVDSFDAMKEAIKGTKDIAVNWSKVDLTPDSVEELKGIPDELAAVTEGISGMRDTIQTELTAAFETGGIDAYTEKAEFFRTQVLEQFPGAFEKMGASSEEATAQATALADELGLMPEDIEIMIQLTREEEARAALDAFSSVISQLPESAQVTINTAVAQGDVEAALGYLNTELINRGYDPIVLPTDADTAGATTAVDDAVAYADGAQGIMGLGANPTSAEGTISDVEDGRYEATVDTGADTGEAEGDISKVEKAKYAATIKATADTAEAAGKLLDEESKPRLAVIVAKALTLAAAAELDGVADKARTADIKADANTGAAESELNNTARNRTAVITADAQTGAAESELNRTARNRSTTITAHTVTIGGGGNTTTLMTSTARGRGRGAATYAAPAPVTANVTINTSVIGNRYDTMRAVTEATRRAIRLAGSRTVQAS